MGRRPRPGPRGNRRKHLPHKHGRVKTLTSERDFPMRKSSPNDAYCERTTRPLCPTLRTGVRNPSKKDCITLPFVTIYGLYRFACGHGAKRRSVVLPAALVIAFTCAAGRRIASVHAHACRGRLRCVNCKMLTDIGIVPVGAEFRGRRNGLRKPFLPECVLYLDATRPQTALRQTALQEGDSRG